MTIQVLPNGIGQALGDDLVVAVNGSMSLSGSIFYVHKDTGSDAAGNDGMSPEFPLATLARAMVLASNDDIIVCLSGHVETPTAVLDINKKVAIIGAGTLAGKPTVTFQIDAAADNLFTVTSANVELRNLWIKTSKQANSSPRIRVSAGGFRMVGCYVECSGTDDAAGLYFATGAGTIRLANTTFISTSTSTSSLPAFAIFGFAAVSDLEMDGCVFDNGLVGFATDATTQGYAAFFDEAVTRLRAQDISLLRGADIRLNATSTGWIQVATVSGGARVRW